MSRRHQENFPVASFLLPRPARAGVLALYQFARGADDVADNFSLPVPEKVRQLETVDAALEGKAVPIPDWAAGYIALCRDGCCNAQDGRDLLRAFLMDQEVTHCRDWAAMLDYCRYSALPVGRSFLALCGEKQADGGALFALCACLQLINHLQDIREDYTRLGRVYLPADWLAEAGVPETALGAVSCSFALRSVINRVLTAMLPLLAEAERLPATVRSRRLRMELRWVLAVVRLLHRRLGAEDPLARRIRPGFWGKLYCLWLALFGIAPLATASAAVVRSSSRSLSPRRRGWRVNAIKFAANLIGKTI